MTYIVRGEAGVDLRLDLVRGYADSVDGTFLGFGPKANWPRLVKWLDRLAAPPPAELPFEIAA